MCVCSGAGEGRGEGGARELSEAHTYPFRPNKGVHRQDHITSFLKTFSKALAICNYIIENSIKCCRHEGLSIDTLLVFYSDHSKKFFAGRLRPECCLDFFKVMTCSKRE